jgi:ABC-type glutathione transport system ATPase component
MSTATPVFSARSISKTYRMRNGGTHRAVNDVSFDVFPGEIVALVGESGSGKSSLARIALCLMAPDAGEISLNGTTLTNIPPKRLRELRTAMQPVFQDSSTAFNPRRTVEQLLTQATPKSLKLDATRRRARIIRLLEQVRLRPAEALLARYPHELSGGQRQRLSIARAIAMEPVFIVADEPLSGADVSTRGEILNLFLDIQAERDVSYLFITHDISIARAFAHRVLVMYRGDLVEHGPVDEVIDRPKHEYTRKLVGAALMGREAIDTISAEGNSGT